jgi:regulatory protein
LHVLGALQRTIVLDKALDLLAVRARSTRDLGIRLRRAGARDGDIAWVQDRLTAQGFLNDASFARQLARSKALAGGTSRRRVIGVLRKKGINAEVATAAIDATFADVELDEFGAALAAAEKRLRALASLDPAKRRQRLYAFLARRGYDGDTIRRVLNEIL